MKVLLVSATFNEIKPLYNIALLVGKKDGYLSKHQLEGKDVDILITGVGIASTAYQMGKVFGVNKYDFAINLGIAGAFDRSLIPGEVVNVNRDIISELGAESGFAFLKFDELNLGKSRMGQSFWKIENKLRICNPMLQKLKKVKGITVNTVHGNKESIGKIIRMFNPDVETMEGAAFLHICMEEKIKCVQLRSISNYVEERNQDNWYIETAIEKLNEIAIRLLNTL